MVRLRLLVLSLPLFLAACGTNSEAPAADNIDANGNQVSSVPWNKPEQWETTGQLGQMGQ
jgi:outer membrane biogenesis lipoprotein LolB